jgi:hypothetical protein
MGEVRFENESFTLLQQRSPSNTPPATKFLTDDAPMLLPILTRLSQPAVGSGTDDNNLRASVVAGPALRRMVRGTLQRRQRKRIVGIQGESQPQSERNASPGMHCKLTFHMHICHSYRRRRVSCELTESNE